MNKGYMERGKNKKILRVCSLFSGCGGLDLGFEMAKNKNLKFKTIWANDVNKSACETYKKNFPDVDVVEGDIWRYNIEDIPDCDVILGGFPCQDFSLLRGNQKRKGVNVRRGLLYTKFVEAVWLKKPIIFVAENVGGLISANGGYAIKKITDDFSELGYHIVKPEVINFADYGVPQIRKRVLIVGIRKDLDGTFKFPKGRFGGKHVSVKKALRGVEKAKFNNEHHKISQETTDMLKKIPAGGNYRHVPELANRNWMSLVYRRLDSEKPSSTIIASGGGGTWGYHYSEPRPLTNRERARIQTFPDNFIFKGTPTEVRMQIGNAVPPKGAKILAQAILRHLSNKL